MKSVGTVIGVAMVALVAAYGYHSNHEAERIAAPAPGYYEHFAQIQLKARLAEEADSLPRASKNGKTIRAQGL
ncbi:MAG TPA: hypothetical protein VKT78_08730 [Fimbriimonadaceae bacterium]|nr:hypothetical protein [Fimbriimonadaceae bacterium]